MHDEVKHYHLKPTTYDSWKEIVREADHVLNQVHYEVAAFETQWQGSTTDKGSNPVNINRLSLQKQQWQWQNGLCLKCGKPGHYAKVVNQDLQPTRATPQLQQQMAFSVQLLTRHLLPQPV